MSAQVENAAKRDTNTNEPAVAEQIEPKKKRKLTTQSTELDEKKWWIFNLKETPSTRGAALLVIRCMDEYGWCESYARTVLKAYQQFLHIKKKEKDWFAELLLPSKAVEKMWNQHILSAEYSKDMMLLCHRIVFHNPSGLIENEFAKQNRFEATASALLEHCGVDEVDHGVDGVWSDVFLNAGVHEKEDNAVESQLLTIRIQDHTGEDVYFKMYDATKLGKAFDIFAQRKGVSTINFLFRGGSVNRNHTPRYLGMQDNDLIFGAY
jgi:hypothetical protein